MSIYEIRVKGYLDQGWSSWFDGVTISYDGEGNTVLRGPLPRDTQRDTSKQTEKEKDVPLTSCQDEGKKKGKTEKEKRRSIVSGKKCAPSESGM